MMSSEEKTQVEAEEVSIATMRSREPILSTVCLCAIVRDEISNPGGGIACYLSRILPYVHSAVIVDTGSTDDTLQLLREYRNKQPYKHLHVYEAEFQSFAQ